jgi:hypothetical protein
VSVHLLWIVPLVLSIAFLASPRFRGDIAERRTRRILAAGLEQKRYTVLNDVLLPTGGGTLAVDHIVVSRFGVFVIESLYVNGSVSGGEFQERWKVQRLGRSRRIDNPMHRNAVQAETLGRLLGMPASKIHRVVAISGQRELPAGMPDHLVPVDRLIRYMRKKGTHVLEPEQADRALKAIQEVRIKTPGGLLSNRWNVLNLFLVVVLLAGIWLAFGEDIQQVRDQWSVQQEQRESPDQFHPDGSRKSERELWEDSLICAWSVDTGRCACYEPEGGRADIGQARCRELAERGSILKQ